MQFPYWCSPVNYLSAWSIHSWKWSTEVPSYYCISIYFCLQLCYHLLNMFGCFDVGSINVYNCHILLMTGPFNNYIMTFLSRYNFWPEVYFTWYKYSHPCFLLVPICMEYVFQSLYLNLYVSLKLKWISYRQHIIGSYFYLSIQPLYVSWLQNFINSHLNNY